MANKRLLKKEINYVIDELITDCIVCDAFVSGKECQKIDQLVGDLFAMKADFLSRVNKTDGKDNSKLVKNYYKSLVANFDKKIGEIIAELEKLNGK